MEQDWTQNNIKMIAPWHNTNLQGKLMTVGCLLNVFVAVLFATNGSWYSIFSISVAAWCGMWTYHPRYQHQDAKDINEGREE